MRRAALVAAGTTLVLATCPTAGVDAAFTSATTTAASWQAAAAFPVAAYAFDETTGTAAADLRGGSDATYGGTAGLGDAGATSGSRSVHCTGDDASRVTYPQTVQFAAKDPWTLELRFKAAVVDNEYRILFGKGEAAGGFASRLGMLVVVNGTYGVGVERYDTTGAPDAVYDGIVPATGTWIHLAIVYDGSTLSIYRNGVRTAQGAATLTVPSTASYSAVSCYYHWYSPGNFQGWLDDLYVYDQALTPAQVAADAA